jgi:hypothetical protein
MLGATARRVGDGRVAAQGHVVPAEQGDDVPVASEPAEGWAFLFTKQTPKNVQIGKYQNHTYQQTKITTATTTMVLQQKDDGYQAA